MTVANRPPPSAIDCWFHRCNSSTLSALSICAPLLAFSQTTPSDDEVRKVVQFYYQGKSGVYLVDIKLCEGIHKEGDVKNNCKDEITSGEIFSGDEVVVWMHFFAPDGAKETMLVQYNRNGITRRTSSHNVRGAIRYRVWVPFKVAKAGNWDVKVVYDRETETKIMGTIPILVK